MKAVLRFLYFTDPHVRGTNPRSRKDYYPDTILEKLREVRTLAEELRVDKTLCGGDFFDYQEVSPTVLSSVLRLLLGWEIYGPAGNHDEYGFNVGTIGRTSLGILDAAGLYKLMGKSYDSEFDEDVLRIEAPLPSGKSLVVEITAASSHYEMDKCNDEKYYSPRSKSTDVDVRIHMPHGYVSEKPILEDIPHTTIDEIAGITTANVILCSHEHNGFGIVRKKGVLFVAPGALGRISASVGDVNREVNVALVEVFEDGSVSARLIPIKSALPADEVLDRKALEEEKSRKAALSTFIADTSSIQIEGDFNNPYTLLDVICADKEKYGVEVSPAIANEARTRIQNAQMRRMNK